MTVSILLTPNPQGGPSASSMLAALQAEGVTHAVTVPDFVQFALHERIADTSSKIHNIFTTTEDQALTTAAGLWLGGSLPVVMVQNQGLYKSLNSLRAVCLDAGIPTVIMAGQFGREVSNFKRPMTESSRSMVRLMEPFLDSIGIKHWTVSEEADVPMLAEAFAHAVKEQTASVVLVGRHITWN